MRNAAILAIAPLLSAAVGWASTAQPSSEDDARPAARHGSAWATVILPDGSSVGRAWFRSTRGGTMVGVTVEGLPPGWHGLHVHAIGRCEAPSPSPTDPTQVGAFLSAGGHLGGASSEHPSHAGDLPQLLVMKDGRGSIAFETDRFNVAELTDANGSSIMVHSGADNFANIPPRYSPTGADAMTRMHGDAGTRMACGVVRR